MQSNSTHSTSSLAASDRQTGGHYSSALAPFLNQREKRARRFLAHIEIHHYHISRLLSSPPPLPLTNDVVPFLTIIRHYW